MPESPRYFALGLELGLIEPIQVQQWVDNLIREAESPPNDIIDLAYLGVDNVKELYQLLRKMPDDTSDYEVLRNLFSNLENFPFEDTEACAKLAKNLYFVWCQNDWKCPNDFDYIIHLDDAFDLAFSGTYGSVEDAKQELKEFVCSFKENC